MDLAFVIESPDAEVLWAGGVSCRVNSCDATDNLNACQVCVACELNALALAVNLSRASGLLLGACFERLDGPTKGRPKVLVDRILDEKGR